MKTILSKTWLRYLLVLSVGLFGGWLLFGGSSHSHDHHTHDAGANGTVWTCSMHPTIRDDQPGTCPICAMDLIPATAGIGDDDNFSMVMSEAAMRLAEIQVVQATLDYPVVNLWVPGRITADERKLSTISGHFNGRVTELLVNFTGDTVRKDQPLARVYSDDLIIAQRELIEAYKRRDTQPSVYRAARQRLLFWDLREHQIEEIIQRGEPTWEVEILAPASGVVIERNITRGDYFRTGDTLFQIAEFNEVWVMLDVFERDIALLSRGTAFDFTLTSQPGKTFEAVVSWINPVLNTSNRTVQVRASARNPQGLLKPGMLLNSTLQIKGSEPVVLIPSSAVLWTGPRSIVYVHHREDDGSSRFEAREVTLGKRAGDFFVIKEGIEEGERVVFNGAFKIDSEMQLADRFSMMNRHTGVLASLEDDRVELADLRDEVDATFRRDLTTLVEEYLLLKDALVESDFALAQRYAGEMSTVLQSIGMHRNEGEAHVAWMELYGNLNGHIQGMISAPDIDALRGQFRFVSDLLVISVRQFGVEGVVYQQYCPMTFDWEGSYWLSSREQIANPYLPETMLRCGEVIERLE